MKNILISLTVLLLALPATLIGQNTLTIVHATPDGMAAEITAALGAAAPTTIERLVITGDAFVTFNDCRAIRANFSTSALRVLDFSQAKFENDELPGIPDGQTPNNVGAFNATIPYEPGVSPTDVAGLQVQEVILPPTLKVIGDRFFRRFTELRTIALPATVTHIGPGAFNVCRELRYINFPAGLKRIDDFAFFQCFRLGLSTDPNQAMRELPAGLKGVLGGSAFRETSVFFENIPEGITAIGASCFRPTTSSGAIVPGSPSHPHQSSGSLSLIIHQNVTSIGGGAFLNQSHINNIEINQMTPPETAADAFNGTGGGSLEAVDLYIPRGTEADYNIAPYNQMRVRAVLNTPGSDPSPGGDIDNFDDITVEVDAEPITLEASVTEGADRPIIYTIEEGKEAVATLEGNVLTIVGEGTAQITALVEGNDDYEEASKTIALTVVSYNWLIAPAIVVHGNTVKVVGPSAENFTTIRIDGVPGDDLSGINVGSEAILEATDGAQVIRLVIKK